MIKKRFLDLVLVQHIKQLNLRSIMIRLLLLILVSFFFVEINAQEKNAETPKERILLSLE